MRSDPDYGVTHELRIGTDTYQGTAAAAGVPR